MALQNINMRLYTTLKHETQTELHMKCNFIKLQNSYQILNSMDTSQTANGALYAWLSRLIGLFTYIT